MAGYDEVGNGLTDWMHSNKRKSRDDLLTEFHTNNPTWPDVELDSWVNSKHRYSSRIAALVHPEDIISINFPNLFQQITCPALLISADVAKGAASGEQDIVKMKQQLLQLQVVPVSDVGHNIRREQFARYMDVVQKFFTDLH